MIRKFGILLCVAGLGACSAPYQSVVSTNPAECGGTRGGWCDFTRKTAMEVWPYAQLSTNSYADKGSFVLPPGFFFWANVEVGTEGFAYALYNRYDEGLLREVVIAYRGTENKADDWIYGNFLGRHNWPGLEIARHVRAYLDRECAVGGGLDCAEQVEITLTGHSLGGGIAHYTSLHDIGQRPVLCDPDKEDCVPRTAENGPLNATRSIVFNNSPRFGWGSNDVERISVSEWGDPLALLRFPARKISQRRLQINCTPGAGPLNNHSMRNLADCLTWVAAYDDKPALESLSDNPEIEKPAEQKSEELPAGFDPELRRRSINLYGPGGTGISFRFGEDLRSAFQAVDDFEPVYGRYGGYSLQVSVQEAAPDDGSEGFEYGVSLFRNGEEWGKFSGHCETAGLRTCADGAVGQVRQIVIEKGGS